MDSHSKPYVHLSINAVDTVIHDPEGRFDSDRSDRFATFARGSRCGLVLHRGHASRSGLRRRRASRRTRADARSARDGDHFRGSGGVSRIPLVSQAARTGSRRCRVKTASRRTCQQGRSRPRGEARSDPSAVGSSRVMTRADRRRCQVYRPSERLVEASRIAAHRHIDLICEHEPVLLGNPYGIGLSASASHFSTSPHPGFSCCIDRTRGFILCTIPEERSRQGTGIHGTREGCAHLFCPDRRRLAGGAGTKPDRAAGPVARDHPAHRAAGGTLSAFQRPGDEPARAGCGFDAGRSSASSCRS